MANDLGEDDGNLVLFGTAFPQLEDESDEASALSRKPIPIHEQIVTDERGRQRFHGAFTGGFSAGFFNTVGSKEGFEPVTFKSSRNERREFKQQNISDFLDSEDTSEFGIAPKRVKVSNEFDASASAQKKLDIIEQHIMGNPVDLGVRLLRRLGIRDGKGLGENIEREAVSLDENEEDDQSKKYTCAKPPPEWDLMTEPDEIEPEVMKRFRLAPEDVVVKILTNRKTDRKGLGYKGLDPHTFVTQKGYRGDAKTVTGMRGQAFGVGAFEDDDDDIFAQENMNDYDFELGPARPTERRHAHEIGLGISEGFVKSKQNSVSRSMFPPPVLPRDYKPIRAKLKPKPLKDPKPIEPFQDAKPLVFVGRNEIGKTPKEKSVETSVSVSDAPSSKKTEETALKLEWKSSEKSSNEKKADYLPTNSRFVSAGMLDTLKDRVPNTQREETSEEKAARLKMYGKLTRTLRSYQFASIICKRFNVKLTAENSYSAESGSSKSNTPSFAPLPLVSESTSNIGLAAQINRAGAKKMSSTALQHLNNVDSIRKDHKFELPKESENSRVNVETFTDDQTKLFGSESQNEVSKSEDSKGSSQETETLDALVNFDLLKEVFGEEEDETEDSSQNMNESSIFGSYFAEPETNDGLNKFFQLPDTVQNSQPSSSRNEESRKVSENGFEKLAPIVPKDEKTVESMEADVCPGGGNSSDENEGPALPPGMNQGVSSSTRRDSDSEMQFGEVSVKPKKLKLKKEKDKKRHHKHKTEKKKKKHKSKGSDSD